MGAETNLEKLLADMCPELDETVFTFAAIPSARHLPPALQPIGTFVEAEGLTVIAPLQEVERANLAHGGSWAKISLTVHSSLAAVGLTAAITSALAANGISANVVAGFYHDHLFVPWERRHEAMNLLTNFR